MMRQDYTPTDISPAETPRIPDRAARMMLSKWISFKYHRYLIRMYKIQMSYLRFQNDDGSAS